MKTTFLIHKNFLVIIFSFISLIAFSQSVCWKQIKSGRAHTIAIKNDGTLWAWGSNGYGQRGDNPIIPGYKLTPIQIGTDNNWQQIVAGDYHSLALKTNGTLWAWGQNNLGQLGDGTTANIVVPTQIGTDSNWQQVTTGRQHSTAIKSDGTLWSWGYNGAGILGDGTLIDKLIPTQIGTDTNWLKVTEGYYHTLALKNNFTLWAWGWNENGEIGDGTNVDVLVPTQIGIDSDWQQITGGNIHSVAIKSNGTLWCWGGNFVGQMGNGLLEDLLVPTQIDNQNNWLKVEAGLGHNIAIKTDGTLWTWGLNNYGQIGNGIQMTTTPYAFLIPTQIGTDSDWTKVSAGSHHSFAIKSNDTLWDWGYNSSGMLGDNTTVMKLVPTFIDCNTLSINAINSNDLIHLFPNPTNSNLNIQTLKNVVISKIIITDLTGKVVLTQTTNTTQVNVEPLASGMYIIEAFSGQEKFTSKFVKQ